MNNWDYPLGADNKDAPWNEKILPEKEIEVTVSITLSKIVTIKVDDYIEDEDSYDYSDCDLRSSVESQIKLPMEEGWHIDDFEVIKE